MYMNSMDDSILNNIFSNARKPFNLNDHPPSDSCAFSQPVGEKRFAPKRIIWCQYTYIYIYISSTEIHDINEDI